MCRLSPNSPQLRLYRCVFESRARCDPSPVSPLLQAEELYNEAKRILNLLYDKRSMKLAEVRAVTALSPTRKRQAVV